MISFYISDKNSEIVVETVINAANILKLPVKIGNHFGMGSEHVRTPAHHSPPKLPPIAMVAPFVSFTVAYSWSYSPLLKPMRFPTRLFVVMLDAYSKPSGLHGFLRYYSLSCTVAYFSSFQLMQLLISMRLYSLPLQQITQSLIQSPQTNNAIASSGLRSKLFKHLMY